MSNYIVIVDLETTGLDSNSDQIIEIGALKIDPDTGAVVDQFQTFSKPDDFYFLDDEDEYPYDQNDDWDELEQSKEKFALQKFKLDPFIVKLTGITDEMLIGAPNNEDAVNAFFEFARDCQIWAYNAGFDSKFLNCHTDIHQPLKDIIPLAKQTFPNLPNYKLSTVAKHLNISTDGAHRAIADCLMSKEILVAGLKNKAKFPDDYQNSSFRTTDYTPSENGLFYGKTIVFTGSLITMTRDRAADHASKYGFKIGATVTKKTDILVVGTQDISHLAGHEKSSKHRKAEELIEQGLKIQILIEDDFIKICGNQKNE